MEDLKVPEYPEALATAIGICEDDVFRDQPDAESPVQVFEIGRDLSTELASLMATIRKRS